MPLTSEAQRYIDEHVLPLAKRLLVIVAALLVTTPAHAGGFGAGFGQGIGQQFGGMPAQPYYVAPAQPTQPYYNPYFSQQQQQFTFPNGSVHCTTFQGAFGAQTTCR